MRSQAKQDENVITLFPVYQQQIGLDMAFPIASVSAAQIVIAVLLRKFVVVGEGLDDEGKIALKRIPEFTVGKPFEIAFKSVRMINLPH